MDAEKIYDGVREKRGEALVFLKAIEEMGELIFSLSKFMGEDASFIERVQEEIADVIIMMEQLKIIFFSEEIDRIRQEKRTLGDSFKFLDKRRDIKNENTKCGVSSNHIEGN